MHKLILLFYCLITSSALATDPFALPKATFSTNTTIQVYYSSAKTMANLIKQKSSGLLSETGRLIIAEQVNQLWVQDDVKHIKLIKKFIRLMDRPSKQILIKAKILLIDDTASKQLGISFNGSQESNGTQNAFSFPLIKLNGTHLLEIKLEALAKEGHAFILSSPEIVTDNHQTASIESGEQIPYQERGRYGNTSITFKKAVLSLEVVPTLLPNNKVKLSLLIYQNKPSSLYLNGTPAISTEKLSTLVTMKLQNTLVLGGIREHHFSMANNHLPWVSKLPLIGPLFSAKREQSQHKQLIVMITPSILP